MGFFDNLFSQKCSSCNTSVKIKDQSALQSKITGKIYFDEIGTDKYGLPSISKPCIASALQAEKKAQLTDFNILCFDCAKKIEESKKVQEANLITCPDCLNPVSKRASSCPKCGCPVADLIAQGKAEPQAMQGNSASIPKCPTCGSSAIEKISTGNKLAYVAGVGILAPAFKKVRSQFECKKCGYKW
jgi:hypothetical protein